MGRIRNIIKPNESGTDYVCYVHTKDGVYNKRDIRTNVSRGNGRKTTTYVDSSTGEVIYTRSVELVSDANSKFHIYSTCTDFAKSKNVPRIKVKSNGRHVCDINREYCTYLQCSTGATHRTRGIVAVDIDHLPIDRTNDVVSEVRGLLEKRMGICKPLSIPLPSSYQIHCTNGHVQVFWVLDKEVVINDTRINEVECDDGSKRKMYTFLKNDNWGKYMNIMRFLSILLGGDPQFTGWQIKNMFFTPDAKENVFAGEFRTIWRKGDEWVDSIPDEIEKCSFGDLDSVVDVFMSNPDDSLLSGFYDVASEYGIRTDSILMGLKLCSGFRMSKQAKDFYNITDEDIDKSCDVKFRADAELVNMGRNQFVRMKTLEVIRRRRNKLTREYCYDVVKKEFAKAIKDGILKGTFDKDREYTDSDFDRDFDCTFDYGTNNYKNLMWSDKQRETAAKTNRSKKTRKLALLIEILDRNPSLIRNTARNNRKIIDLFKSEYDIEIKTVNTISSYKRELKLKDSQSRIGKRNYRAIAKRSNESETYSESMKSVYTKMSDKGFFYDSAMLDAWRRRIENVCGNDVYATYRNAYRTKWNKDIYKQNYIYETHRHNGHGEAHLLPGVEHGNEENTGRPMVGRDTFKKAPRQRDAPFVFKGGNISRSSRERPSLYDGVPLQVCRSGDT